MKFERNKYLTWYIPKVRAQDGAINLHSSGVPALNPADLNIDSGDPWTAVGRFEASIAEWLEIDSTEVLFTPGATGGNLLALMTLAGAGGQAIVECPIYEPMLRQSERLCQVDRLIRRPESEWRLPLNDAEKLITKETGLVSITEPHNPSGCYAPSQEVLELAEMARRHKAILLINEVYRGFSERPSYHGMADNIVVVSSLSKLLGTYWARLGWLSAPEPIIARLRNAHLNMGSSSSPSAETGISVMSRIKELGALASSAARQGEPIVNDWVKGTGGTWWQRPEGPGYGCISLPSGIDDVELAERLHQKMGVLTVPGTYFEAPGTLRIAWLQSGDQLKEGLERVASAL